MGKKAKWLIAVKNVFRTGSNKKKGQKLKKSKKKRCICGMPDESDDSMYNNAQETANHAKPPRRNSPPLSSEDIKPAAESQERNKHAQSLELASTVAAEVALPTISAEDSNTTSAEDSNKSREELAAIRIQTAFRGYMAKSALHALRGTIRLKSLIQGSAFNNQATNTLHYMQKLVRIQAQIHVTRNTMLEQNQLLQKQLLVKYEREPAKSKTGKEWDDHAQSKKQIEVNLSNKQEAAIRKERAMAYAFSHQWKASSRSVNPMFTNPSNLNWEWSWLKHRMALRPWKCQLITDKETNSDIASVKSLSYSYGGGEKTNAFSRRDIAPDRISPTPQKSTRPSSCQSPSTPSDVLSPFGRKIKPSSPRDRWGTLNDDSRSVFSINSDQPRRYSMRGSSVRDDESLMSSPAVPGYMAPTESSKAKARAKSPLSRVPSPDNILTGSAKKRLSFTGA